MKKIILLVIASLSLVLSGCISTGFDKKIDIVPDELSVSGDYDPIKNQVDEITGAIKWRLK